MFSTLSILKVWKGAPALHRSSGLIRRLIQATCFRIRWSDLFLVYVTKQTRILPTILSKTSHALGLFTRLNGPILIEFYVSVRDLKLRRLGSPVSESTRFIELFDYPPNGARIPKHLIWRAVTDLHREVLANHSVWLALFQGPYFISFAQNRNGK